VELFRYRCLPGQEPLENFTTAALAIAVRHDFRPMAAALAKVAEMPAAELIKIEPRIQVFLPPVGEARTGYLDLVLSVTDSRQQNHALWVEVKVDAGEGEDQIANYRRHASNEPVRPVIITLGRTPLRDDVPALRWRDIVAAIDNTSDPHYWWLALRDFLLEERIFVRPLPSHVEDPGPVIDVVLGINRLIGQAWPTAGIALIWANGTLRRSLQEAFGRTRDLGTTAGPMRYGLELMGGEPTWCLTVTARRNYQRIQLDSADIARDAEVGGLDPSWVRRSDHLDALQRSHPLDGLREHDAILAWFREGLRQLHQARVLDRYLAGIAAKHPTSPQSASAETLAELRSDSDKEPS
jgi:hypothetical protein